MNETFVIEDIKLKAIGSPTEVLSRRPAPEATMPHLRKLIRRRMSFHYGRKEVQAVAAKKYITGLGSKNRFGGRKLARRQSGRRTVEAMSAEGFSHLFYRNAGNK